MTLPAPTPRPPQLSHSNDCKRDTEIHVGGAIDGDILTLVFPFYFSVIFKFNEQVLCSYRSSMRGLPAES